MVGPFTMLTFLDPADPGAVNVENVMGSLALEKPKEIQAYEEVWGAIEAKAVSPSDFRAVMKPTHSDRPTCRIANQRYSVSPSMPKMQR